MAFRDLFRRQAPRLVERVEPRLALPPIGHNGGPPMEERAAPASSARLGRAWLAAQPSRLLAELPGGAAVAVNREIRAALPALRNRSRWLAQNDGFAKGFFRNLRRNVVGPSGFSLQMQVKTDRGDGLDTDANGRLEAAFAEWSRVGVCDVTGKLSLADVERLMVTCTARDGEALVRFVRGARFNRFGFALQVIDPSLLETELNIAEGAGFGGYRLPPGSRISMGVELNEYERPVAYWLRTTLPGDTWVLAKRKAYQRVPAEDVLHLFVADWPHQVRGVPWLEAGVRSLAMLDGYAEAELTAARVAASKMGFYELDGDAEPEEIDGQIEAQAKDAQLVQEAVPGTFELLPKGVTLKPYDPQHPAAGFGAFCAAILRHAAAGAGLSYNAFANDAERLNYSALRATELEDRDEYRTIQDWMIGAGLRPIFSAWLREALLYNVTGLPAGKLWKFDAPRFRGRGWSWVDPASEVAAARDAVALGIKSRTQIVGEAGGDFAETVRELLAEQEAMKDLKPMALPGSAAPSPSRDAAGSSGSGSGSSSTTSNAGA